MDNTLEELLENLCTVAQRDYFMDSLDMLGNALYSSHQTIYQITALTLSLPLSDLVSRMYREQNLFENDKDSCNKIINTIKNSVKSLEAIEMRVAYNISEADAKDIRNWLYFQLKRHILINVIVDPSLVGGIIIYRNGIYRDYSVSSYIDQYGRV